MMEQTFVIDLFSGQLVVPIDIFHEFFSLGFFINLFSGQLVVSIDIFHELFSLGFSLLFDFQREQFPTALEQLLLIILFVKLSFGGLIFWQVGVGGIIGRSYNWKPICVSKLLGLYLGRMLCAKVCRCEQKHHIVKL